MTSYQRALKMIDPKLSAMENFRRLPEMAMAEVIDGKLFVMESPTIYHQRIGLKITLDLARYVIRHQLGEVFHAPIGLYLSGKKGVVEPDIIFVSKKNKVAIDKKGIHGPPDLLIEIQSPSTRKRDRTIKKDLFEKSKVKEYWMVDPITKDSWGYLLEGECYGEPLCLNSKIEIRILSKTICF